MLVHAVGQTVCGWIIGRDVHGNLIWIESFQDAHKLRLDGFVVADHLLIRTSPAGSLRFQITKNGDGFDAELLGRQIDGFAGTGDDQCRRPGKSRPVNQRQDRVRHGTGFPNEGHPKINVFFFKDGYGLTDFFLKERIHGILTDAYEL